MKKVSETISGLMVITGILLLAGTAGASDCNAIEFLELITQTAISFLFMVSGLLIYRIGGNRYV